MKKFLTAPAFLFFMYSFSSFGQDCNLFIPERIGSIVETTSFDKKGKETGINTLTVKNIESTPQGKKITVENVSKQKKGDEATKADFVMYCKNGRFIVDMKQFVPQDPNSQNANAKIEASEMDYPLNMQVGQALSDGHISISMTAEGMPMPMVTTVDITNRKITGQEEIVTAAGSFNCFKIEYNVSMKMMFKMSMKATEWVAVGVGTVKSETYDSNGKLVGYNLLTRLVK
jgi:hypothetical protein